MVFCQNCGNEVDDDAKFCASCGTPMDGSTPAGNTQQESSGNLFDDIKKPV